MQNRGSSVLLLRCTALAVSSVRKVLIILLGATRLFLKGPTTISVYRIQRYKLVPASICASGCTRLRARKADITSVY